MTTQPAFIHKNKIHVMRASATGRGGVYRKVHHWGTEYLESYIVEIKHVKRIKCLKNKYKG